MLHSQQEHRKDGAHSPPTELTTEQMNASIPPEQQHMAQAPQQHWGSIQNFPVNQPINTASIEVTTLTQP